ncbi:MAG: hypothetical protein LBC22_03720 [Endomicrobium sp.]|jgi:diadenosine tetraphosphate (Ap4A) HIT family hydrolase|nr:hypothetical protein [Endomicrobium sp.]MDR2616903.1 hypothetical protein [Endomicrobium sp.]
MGCLTCQILQGDLIPPGGIFYRDQDFLICHTLDVNILGYMIVSPVRHIQSYDELSSKEAEKLGLHIHILTRFLKTKIHDIEKTYICSFNEETHHLHFHVFPRYPWMLSSENIHTDGKIDAAKIFSQMRKTYKVGINEEMKNKIYLLAEQFKVFLSEYKD